MEKIPKLYEFMRPIVTNVINGLYNPKYINSEYIPKDSGAIIAGNHKFCFDPLLVDICAYDRCVYSMMWYQYYDLLYFFFKLLGTIRVKPHKSHSLDKAVEHLNKGHLINIFPEGQMNKSDEILLPFKKGTIAMAQKAHCPIVPFVIKGEWKIRSKDLRIVYGPPIDVNDLSFEEANNLLYNIIKKMLLDNSI